MKNALITSGAMLLIAAGSVLAADDMSANNTSSRTMRYDDSTTGIYRANELSIDGFGTDSIGHYTINHLSGDRVWHSSRLGAGLGLNYFITRYVGIGGDAYTENTAHNFVDNASVNLIFRIPIGETGLAPYVYGGGGHKFDPINATFWQLGVGLEYRFTPHFGLFVDARYVNAEKISDYGVGRVGARFAF